MKITFSKINVKDYPFKLDLENIIFEGKLTKINPKLIKINALMQGCVQRNCDSCGIELKLEIKENLELFASDGVFKDKMNELSNTIEFFDGNIDLEEIAISELQAYLSDYFYCKDCDN
ncbi:hypothetical protein LNU06_01190 [Campylobacter sp. VicNov18]|uniref:hypothetical protein n=1 Tax=Campylobacter bilis TaxID=2691918 RepID=UPI00130DA07B|nr:hypothetical protein [Campylobacter bilis]MPV63281.1 hypothetical protein [Campylobacter hepaticus]MBM0636780.1 hypothetical protein [Campylobacter bilis]MCC8277352.1 hypothetical protein [Campylobacter bilis]MCC8299095.1 hypothetical protein [Campylobacter bilis]MCC8300261.1 hypothetical protein [Campylobacter bilis]